MRLPVRLLTHKLINWFHVYRRTQYIYCTLLKLKIYLSFTHDSIYMFDDLTLLFTFE